MAQKSIYSLKNFNILLVEDFDFVKTLIVAMLRIFGVGSVTTCINAQEAIEILSANMTRAHKGISKPFDFVLTDWMMPDGSAPELIKWIRNHELEAIRFLPIIVISTFASEDVVTEARDFGVNEVLVKPVSADKVATRILSIIDQPRPFVKTISFFGPDRRRRDQAWKKEERRKTDSSEVLEHSESF